MVQKIIIICGPTASGKSRLGIELAGRFSGEIVSADSGAVWRGFDIGTAKPSAAELALIPHHLIGVADPAERFDAARFVEMSDAAIAGIAGRGRVPFVVGGTGLYIRMLVHGICGAPPRDTAYRAGLEHEARISGVPALHRRLEEVDPVSASEIKPTDRARVIRALEIFHLADMPASELRRRHGFTERRYDALKIGLSVDRAELYHRIAARVDRMIEGGLLDEARGMHARYGERCQAFAAVGYREIAAHLAGELDLASAVRLMKRNSRRFAKRQMTWFRSDEDIRWFDQGCHDGIVKEVERFLQEKACPIADTAIYQSP